MGRLINLVNRIKVKLREKTNPLLGPIRRKKLLDTNFTIISNNCWAGHVYRYYNIPYNTPTVGMYFFTPEYLKFIKNLKYYLESDIKFIPISQSKYKDELMRKGGENLKCPIGLLKDVEIVFLHYRSEEEARIKWERRKKRVNYDNILIKMSEQNLCTEKDILEFDSIENPFKFIFTHKDYQIKSQIIMKEWTDAKYIVDDTTHFRRHINTTKWLNHQK